MLKNIRLEEKGTVIFLLLLVLISLLYNYHEILGFRPYSIHQWRQADCASMILNYCEEGLNFFQPSIHFQGINEGKGVAEFPILFYINAILWKIFGKFEIIPRIINIGIVFCGLFYFYKTCSLLLKNIFWSITIPLFVFTSPVFVFYTNTFMANAPAISLVFIGWYFFTRFSLIEEKKNINRALFFFTLAALLRSTSVIGFAFVYIIWFLEWGLNFKFKSNGKIFSKPKKYFSNLAMPLVSIILWYGYAMVYNKVNKSSYFLTKIRPFYDADNKLEILETFYEDSLPQLFHFSLLWISMVLAIILIYKMFKISRVLWVVILSVFFLTFIYLFLWFQNLDVHDYYLIDTILLVAITLFGSALLLKKLSLHLFNSRIIQFLVLFYLGFNIYYCAANNRIKYSNFDKLAVTFPFFSQEIREYWDYYHWNYDETLDSYETITPYLRSLGIKREELVISLPDPSPNISLYLMDQKGFTDLYFSDLTAREKITLFYNKGAKYLILNNKKGFEESLLKDIEKSEVGSYKKVKIFDLDKYFSN